MADHKPYIPADATIPEFTFGAVLAGAVLGIIFGASSLYLVLKVGMTVSASIPVAVLSITLFRWLGGAFGWRNRTILENNITQTTGSAGESIAFGVGVTMPALMLIGFEMEFPRVMVVSVLGGLLGILMMIPLRRAFIVHLHGKAGEPGTLLYPEGTACAQVLISGDKGGSGGGAVFIGFGLAFAHKFITEGMNLLSASVTLPLKLGANATDAFSRVAKLSGEMASELLGVGYIIGMRTSSIMMAGAVLGGLVIVPTVAITASPSLTSGDISRDYLRYIGAGCVAAAGIISMVRTMPMIVRSFSTGVGSLRGGSGGEVNRTVRTEDDLPPKFVLGGGVLLLGLLAAFLLQEVVLKYALMGALLVMLFGFLFVTVSSRLTGEIGSSSNPISGMTVATLLMTCLIFLALGWTTPQDAVLALSIGGVVCIAASNGGTTSQDLKTGFLIGATPRLQQWAILIGAFTSAIVIGGTLILFNQAGTIFSQRNLPSVNLKAMLSTMAETATVPQQIGEAPMSGTTASEEFHVFRPNQATPFPSLEDPAKIVVLKPGKYLVDANGWIRFRVDPTITGELTEQDIFEPIDQKEPRKPLSADQLKMIPDTITAGTTDGGQPRRYRIWKNDKEFASRSNTLFIEEFGPGEFLVDEQGNVVATNNPRKVPMKFTAPKTQVMGIIINGLLGKNLNWSLILIGACLSVALELCGVSSLAFAVGVYIPMQYSTPIFLGGVVRWGVDRWMATKAAASIAAAPDEASKAEAEVRAIAESESSPGMLLSSGLIAGGSLAGVLLAFLNFPPFAPVQKALDFAELVAHAFHSTPDAPSDVQQMLALAVFGLLVGALALFGIGFWSPRSADE